MSEINSQDQPPRLSIALPGQDIQVYGVIATYNGSSFIEGCLNSLKNSLIPVAVIVVDNASTDNTCQIVASFENVICLPQKENLGFAGANNIGIAWAYEQGAAYVFLLNQDAQVSPETIGCLVDAARDNEQFGVFSPVHLNNDGSALDYPFSRHIAVQSPATLHQWVSDLYKGSVKAVYPLSFVNAAAWLITRACLERVGGFDPIFFMYGEDADFCNRLTFHSFRLGLVPGATIFHSRGKNYIATEQASKSKVNVRKESKMLSMGMVAYLKDPGGSFARKIARWINDTMHQMLQALLKPSLKEFAALSLAALRTLQVFPILWQHRKLVRQPGAHWISPR